MISRVAYRLAAQSSRSALSASARRAASTDGAAQAAKKAASGDTLWIAGSAIIFGPAIFYLLTPPDPHKAHAHHVDYRMKNSGVSDRFKAVPNDDVADEEAEGEPAEEAAEDDGDAAGSTVDDKKTKGKDEQGESSAHTWWLTLVGTQVAKPSAQGPDKTKFAIASEEARKQSANDEEGFSPDPKKHKEQVESLDEVDKKKKDSKEDGTAASAATDKTE